jgi:two-component system chemotaxis sensor kinase CheA
VSEPTAEILELAREETGESLARIESNLLALENGAAEPDTIDAMFRDAHSIKGAAGMVGMTEAAAIASAMEDRLETCRESGELPVELVEPLLAAADALRRALAGEEVAMSSVHTWLDAPASSEPQPARPAEPGLAPTPASSADESSAAPRAIRVGAHKVDRMLDAVGETVLHHRRLEHEFGAVAEGELDMGERLLTELQRSVLAMRTVPLSSITHRYGRAVRDLSVAGGLEVELEISGAQTQLDRLILEGISDPLTHLIRNAVAHGIEPPEERERAGKPRIGRVELRGEQRGSLVAIEVSDDGRGIPPELVARAAEAGSLTDLLSTPGFSTAAEVSDIAGRGVGMDAVRKHVERMGGTIEVVSEPTRGMKVTLLLPLTLAVMRVLLCERDGRAFGLPLASVREVATVTETVALGARKAVVLEDQPVPVLDLAAVLGASAKPLPASPMALVLTGPSGAVAVACDRVLGDEEVVTKSLGPLLAGLPGYLGGAILGDGRVVLILDPSHLLNTDRAAQTMAGPLAEPERRGLAPNVLVVDDQFTVRELQRSILETAGYRVETARDGKEALARIGRDSDVDMVLTDVQMPNMDGFELLQAIRGQPEHSSLPVAIVTSRGGDEDRRRGVEEGADAYIVKQEFDQKALLETIGRLVGR